MKKPKNKNQIIGTERNNLCICGSAKKYKHCCICKTKNMSIKEISMNSNCKFPDFENELHTIDYKLFLKKENEEYSSFFLKLSCIFNDLKFFLYCINIINNMHRVPTAAEISSHNGEMGGMNIQIVKYCSSILSEFFKLIQSNEHIMRSEKINNYLRLIDKDEPNFKKDWNNVMNIAFNENYCDKEYRNNKFFSVLTQIRSNISFHYDEKDKIFLKNFKKFFEKNELYKGKAYYSFNTTISEARFYYADAVVSSYIENIVNNNKITPNDFLEVLNSSCTLIGVLVVCYLEDIKSQDN